MDVIADEVKLPDARFDGEWHAIKTATSVRDRLLAQALLAFTMRQRLPFEIAPLHGLILLAGPPGTGKTTLARGLANEVAKMLQPKGARFVQVNPHALASSALGRSQKEVTKIFQQTIPELAASGAVIVLLDEVETLVVDRRQLSLEANPIDVHRATDAALAGLDLLTRQHANVLLIATTNFPKAVDAALLSRADLIEQISLPDAEARAEILRDVLHALTQHWPGIEDVQRQMPRFVQESDGLDGRRLRKAVIAAIGNSIETARDPNTLKAAHVVAALRSSLKDPREDTREDQA
jgi:AAA+ superfamily predicted ATPase